MIVVRLDWSRNDRRIGSGRMVVCIRVRRRGDKLPRNRSRLSCLLEVRKRNDDKSDRRNVPGRTELEPEVVVDGQP